MSFLLKYWQFAVGAIIALVLVLPPLYGLHALNVRHIKAESKKALDAQVAFDITKCEDSQKPTGEGNEQYQKIIAARDARIVELSKRPARCVYVSKPADSTQAPSGERGNGNGLPYSVLLKFAGFCEAYRGSAETLYDFNQKVRCKLK